MSFETEKLEFKEIATDKPYYLKSKGLKPSGVYRRYTRNQWMNRVIQRIIGFYSSFKNASSIQFSKNA